MGGTVTITPDTIPNPQVTITPDAPKEGWGLPHTWKEAWSRLISPTPMVDRGHYGPGGKVVPGPGPILGDVGEVLEGSGPALTGLTAIGTAGMGVEAIAAKSLAPLYPLARGILGAAAGKFLGKEVGGLVGQPEAGGTIGSLAGGMYAAGGGKVPTKGDIMEFFNRPEFQETGAPLPSVEEFYANHGKDIMAAMKQQPEAFGIPSPPEGAPLPSVAEFYEKRGREIMGAIRQQPEAFGFTKGAKGLEVPTEEPSGGSPQDLISRTKKIVQPGAQPSAEDLKRAGDLTQAPLPKLKLLADWGDELAKNEIRRRLRNQ